MTPLTRRHLLHSGAASAAIATAAALCPRALSATTVVTDIIQQSGTPSGSASATASATESPTPPAIRLGLASYTFRNFTRAQLIGFMQQLNLSALNAKDVKDHLPMNSASDPFAEAQALQAYAAAHITLHAAGAISFANDPATNTYAATDADIEAKFAYCQRANIPVIVASDPAPSSLPRIEKFVKQYNIRFAIHNHGPEDPLWPSPLTVLHAVQSMDPRMGCCIDVGHCVRAGTNVVDAIHSVGPRLFNLHMKDLTSFTDKASQVPVGDGKMPVRAIFQALLAIHYPGFVDLEYEVHPDTPMPGVLSSFAYMRGVLNGMA